MFDLVIRGANVVDGLGQPPRITDVAVADGRIAEVGPITGNALQTVDAGGLTLGPGFVDIHTHFDAQLTWDVTASPSPALGTTTVVMGNCGFGIAPCPPHLRETMMANLSVVEGMDLDALRAGIDWDFESFPEYMDLLRRRGTVPNAAVLVGHSAVRTAVMGEAASERTTPSADELTAMKAIIGEAMESGAIGFASSFSPNHIGAGGRPMPSTVAEDGELADLIDVFGRAGRGICQIATGTRITAPMLEEFARRCGRPMFMTSSLTMYNEALPGRATEILDECQAARDRGHEVHAQITCQPLAFDFTPANAYPFYSHDAFAEIKGAGPEILKQAFADDGFRDRFRDDLATPKPGTLFFGAWDRVEIVAPAHQSNAGLANRTIAEAAADRGVDPVDFFFDLGLEEDLQTAVVARLLNVEEDGVASLLKHPASVIGLSDAGAHLIYMCDAGFGLHFLGHWVRERGDFGLVEGIRRLTSHPADLYRIPDRGRIAPGAWADMLLFDPETVGISPPMRVPDLPAGGTRTIRRPNGVAGVWVNGINVFDGQDYVDLVSSPGHVLDRFDA